MDDIITRQPLLTVEEAAAWLRMTPAAIYAAVCRGQLPVVRIGRRLRFDRRDLESLLSEASDRSRHRPAITMPVGRSVENLYSESGLNGSSRR